MENQEYLTSTFGKPADDEELLYKHFYERWYDDKDKLMSVMSTDDYEHGDQEEGGRQKNGKVIPGR